MSTASAADGLVKCPAEHCGSEVSAVLCSYSGEAELEREVREAEVVSCWANGLSLSVHMSAP